MGSFQAKVSSPNSCDYWKRGRKEGKKKKEGKREGGRKKEWEGWREEGLKEGWEEGSMHVSKEATDSSVRLLGLVFSEGTFSEKYPCLLLSHLWCWSLSSRTVPINVCGMNELIVIELKIPPWSLGPWASGLKWHHPSCPIPPPSPHRHPPTTYPASA